MYWVSFSDLDRRRSNENLLIFVDLNGNEHNAPFILFGKNLKYPPNALVSIT